MAPFFSLLLALSMIGLLVCLIVQYFGSGNWRRFWFQAAALALAAVVVYGLFWSRGVTQAKGDQPAFAFVLYLCMVLGMLAHAAYVRFEQPKAQRPPFDWGAFLAPLFASPIVFIPLLAALQNANVDLEHLTAPRLMVFFVAFENGFFWKEYFDHRRQNKCKDADA